MHDARASTERQGPVGCESLSATVVYIRDTRWLSQSLGSHPRGRMSLRGLAARLHFLETTHWAKKFCQSVKKDVRSFDPRRWRYRATPLEQRCIECAIADLGLCAPDVVIPLRGPVLS